MDCGLCFGKISDLNTAIRDDSGTYYHPGCSTMKLTAPKYNWMTPGKKCERYRYTDGKTEPAEIVDEPHLFGGKLYVKILVGDGLVETISRAADVWPIPEER